MLVCGCSGRGIVGNDEGGDTSGDEDSSDSGASLDSVGSIADADSAESASSAESADEGAQPEDQQWLLAIATFLDPSQPLQWHVVVDYENGELVELRLQSLSLDMGSITSPRQLVGAVTVTSELAVDDVGYFGLVIEELRVPPEANPITGSAITAVNVRLSGMGTATTSCGTVEGDVLEPIATPLTGSTFAATPITSVDALPLEFPAACP